MISLSANGAVHDLAPIGLRQRTIGIEHRVPAVNKLL
jgi:hypothetical protein